MTPAEGVQALLDCLQRIARLTMELETAQAEKKMLEQTTLPTIFLAARQTVVGLTNGARATKAPYAYARLAKEGPKRVAMLEWLAEIGEENAITADLTAKWPKGQIDVARQVYNEVVKKAEGVTATLEENVHWRTLEGLVLRAVTSGKHIVPLDEIGATFGDRVTITKHPATD